MAIRLFVKAALSLNEPVLLDDNQTHYLLHVMRQSVHDFVCLFNGTDGEWQAEITELTKKRGIVCPVKQLRKQDEDDILDAWLCFAPVKKDCTDMIVEKATELGVQTLFPIITHRTVIPRINTEKMFLRAKEASEQCERLSVPKIKTPMTLTDFLASFPQNRTLYYLNERGEGAKFQKDNSSVAFLVGPEGGFTEEEIKALEACPQAISLHLGRRILRAETACIAILAAWNQQLNWNVK